MAYLRTSHFDCANCDEQFETTMTVEQLLSICAGSHDGRLRCDNCDGLCVIDRDGEDLISDGDYYHCIICRLNVDTKKQLIAHKAQEHDYCEKCKSSIQDGVEHLLSHHHGCRHCYCIFRNKNQLDMVSAPCLLLILRSSYIPAYTYTSRARQEVSWVCSEVCKQIRHRYASRKRNMSVRHNTRTHPWLRRPREPWF